MLADFIETIVKIIVVVVVLLTGFAYMTWFERRVIARLQVRIGPNRVGPEGLLQPLADGVKLFFKEDIIPAEADKVLYLLAPVLAVVPSLLAAAVLPFGPDITLFGRTIHLYIADINIALLYFLGLGSLGVYSVVLAGWASNNKYALLGGLRASAQMISYELAMGLSVLSIVMLAGSFSLVDIVNAQAGGRWFVLMQPLAFIIFIITMLAETKRAPFDLPEAEQELVAGFHTEYSGMKFALFYMGEYIGMIVISGVAVSLFLGGWRGPFAEQIPLLGVLYFFLKVALFMFFFVWMRATLPRLRYDRLMQLGWKVLLPLSLANVVITALAVVARDTGFFGLLG
ncbi:NADH-quinone oxidoreductase subunit H [Ardenticatena maritima]|uniref:NADH-quinone oxidoreductase subunit H n=1 Tax=Ardenticatena maritima TaxID=872965 RepID=A0A0M9UBU0_9CHLR|nr:NADH-quinone oxidoreductase subunit NuoH [Ardenticatena maritima]KPL89706.1 NADH-quinone oxidoreductase [Ardenticatena maritima]GAP62218.1 NADH-quinone oxidoreductase subunit H [Ardenticatena maritima]